MRNRFDIELNSLNNELIIMGSLCEEAILNAVKLLNNDAGIRIENVLEIDKLIDQKVRTIEAMCMKLLIKQQPVASDLRTISSAIKMISDMERIGDQSSDIAEISKYIKKNQIQGKTHIADMADAAIYMVTNSIESFVKKDISLAKTVIKHDDVVDELFLQIKKELIDAVQNKDSDAEALIDLLMIAKYFERIADHAENIAEWVIYSITGIHDEY